MNGSPLLDGLLSHLGTILGFTLAIVLIARLMREKREPSNKFAWILVIVLIPYLGVPLYLLLGGRKLRKLAARKHLVPTTRPYLLPDQEDGSPVPLHHQYGTSHDSPSDHNRVIFEETGEQAYYHLMKAIRESRRSIDLMTFILGRDETGRNVVAALAAKAREGVRIRLLLDSLGCLKVRRPFLQELLDAGGEVARFMPVLPIQSRWSANLRNHRKIAVFDGAKAIVGGRNLAGEYMGEKPREGRWQDYGVYLEGPVVESLSVLFAEDWAFARKSDPPVISSPLEDGYVSGGNSQVQVMASGPDVDGDPLYEAIVSMIQEADRTIDLVTPYYVPDEVLQRTLIIKAKSGRKVRLIIPERSNHPITDWARSQFLRELNEAGADVLLYGGSMLHAKIIVVDGKVGMTGSANLDMRSLFVNYEVGLFFYTPSDLERMGMWIQRLAKTCHAWKPEPTGNRSLLGTLREDLSRLVAPLL